MRQILAVAAPPLATARAAEKLAIGAPNPASVCCHQQGGRLEIRTSPGGPSGWCHLPDGRVVEEWALFRAAHAQPGTDPTTEGR